MSHHRHTLKKLVALLLCALCGESLADERPAKAKHDGPAGKPYIYKTSAGMERRMEICFPPNHDPAKAKVPGMILFHGGGWSGGTLQQFRVACAYFASRGLVCATAEYQMHDKAAAKLPEGESKKRVCVTDAKSAIRWFKQNACELGIDPARIITGGGSAGGHISALATMNSGLNDPSDPKNIDTRVVAYLWFNPAFALDDDKDSEIDILHHQKADLPPAIVFFGDQDNWKKGWEQVHSKWESLGTKTIDLQIARGQTHGFFNKEPWRGVTSVHQPPIRTKGEREKGKWRFAAAASPLTLTTAQPTERSLPTPVAGDANRMKMVIRKRVGPGAACSLRIS